MNKKTIGLILGGMAIIALLPVQADTTGTVATGVTTDSFYITVDPTTKEIMVTTTGTTNTGTVTNT